MTYAATFDYRFPLQSLTVSGHLAQAMFAHSMSVIYNRTYEFSSYQYVFAQYVSIRNLFSLFVLKIHFYSMTEQMNRDAVR